MKWFTLAAHKPPQALWPVLCVILLVAGCALPRAQAPDAASGQQPPAAPVSAPGTDLMYDLLLAEVAGQRGDYETAFDQYLKVARSTRDSSIAARAMQIAVFMRDKERALNAARLWVDIDPASLEARQGLVVFLIRNGQADEALPHLEQILTAARSAPAPTPPAQELDLEIGASAHGFMQIAALLGAEEDKQAALTLMARFVAGHDSEAEAHFAYANLAFSAGDPAIALAATEKALQRKPGWPGALVLQARVLHAQGNSAEAITALGKAVKQSPKNLPLRLAYARMLVDAKRTKEAQAQFALMAKQAKDNVDVLLALGLVSMQIRQQDDAERYFRQALKLGKRSPEAHYYLGQIAESKKKPRAAIGHYKAVTEGDAWFDAQLRIAQLTAKESGLAAGRAYLHTIKAKAQNPQQEIQITLAEGDLLSQRKLYGEAQELYNNALTEQPNNNDLLYARAMLAEKLGRIDLLELDLRAILEREPENAAALNGLGYTLADRTTRYQEALEYIQRALQLRPQDPSIIDSMGWVLYRLGRHQEALRYLKSALELADDAEIAAHLGEVLWVTGDQKGALEVWEQGLKANADNEVLLNTMKRFSR